MKHIKMSLALRTRGKCSGARIMKKKAATNDLKMALVYKIKKKKGAANYLKMAAGGLLTDGKFSCARIMKKKDVHKTTSDIFPKQPAAGTHMKDEKFLEWKQARMRQEKQIRHTFDHLPQRAFGDFCWARRSYEYRLSRNKLAKTEEAVRCERQKFLKALREMALKDIKSFKVNK